jgi:hypothetical protein
MKTQNFAKMLLTIAASAGFLAMNLAAQDAATTASGPQLSPAAAQVLQLAQAKVGDDTIVAYIQNSGTIYGLNANQIVYLKQQGVSSSVINTMLNQRTRLAATTGVQPDNSAAAGTQASTAVAQPTVTYETVPSPTAYVIPDTQTYNYDAYYYQPYYYPYYAWPYPAVSLSFGYGGIRGGGYYHGGGFHGGGFHGGGGWHH